MNAMVLNQCLIIKRFLLKKKRIDLKFKEIEELFYLLKEEVDAWESFEEEEQECLKNYHLIYED